ncbi:putative ribonuclease H-like domain-containing protein [Tanacetum coccineum]
MFNVDALDGEEVFVAGQNENVVKEIVDASQNTKPKAKGIAYREPGESTTTIFLQQLQDKGLSQDKGKGVLVEPKKPLKNKDQLKLDEEIALKLQAEIDEEERIARAEEENIDEANITWDDIQVKVDADYELAKRLQDEQEQFIIEKKVTLFKELLEQRRKHYAAKRAEEKRNKPPTKTQQKKIMITYLKNMEGWKHKDLKSKDFDFIKELFNKAFTKVNMFVDFRTELVEGSSKRAGEELEQENKEEVAIDVVPLATKSPSIIDWKIHKKGKKSYYQIVRADGKSQMYKLVKAKYGSTRPVEDLYLVLWNDLKTLFKPHVEDEIWKLQQRYKVLSWKLFDLYGVHCLSLQSGMIYMLVEKRYPLTPPIIIDMLNKKLQGRIIGIKSLLNAASITAALIDVNDTQSKLYKVNAAEGVNAASEEVSIAKLVSTAYVIHAGFYRHFIKDFSKIARTLTKLLEKGTPFEFNDECHKAFNSLKEKLTCTPVIVSPNWKLPFELICDVSEFAVGAVLGKSNEHLSRIDNDEASDDSDVDDNFPGETLMEITTKDIPWFADFVNYLAISYDKRQNKSQVIPLPAALAFSKKVSQVSQDLRA